MGLGKEERAEGEKEGQGEYGGELEGTGKDEMEERQRWRARKDILIEGVIMGLVRNLALEKFPGIHKNDLS